jgi:outer membrane lipoprotein SlyB
MSRIIRYFLATIFAISVATVAVAEDHPPQINGCTAGHTLAGAVIGGVATGVVLGRVQARWYLGRPVVDGPLDALRIVGTVRSHSMSQPWAIRGLTNNTVYGSVAGTVVGTYAGAATACAKQRYIDSPDATIGTVLSDIWAMRPWG